MEGISLVRDFIFEFFKALREILFIENDCRPTFPVTKCKISYQNSLKVAYS